MDRWTVYEGRPNGKRAANGLRVTLGYGRTFYLNHAAFEALGKPEAVELLFDNERDVIGIRGSDPRRENAFPVKPHSSGRYKRISAVPFCAEWNIRVRETLLFHGAYIGPHGVLELPLAKVVRVARGAR